MKISNVIIFDSPRFQAHALRDLLRFSRISSLSSILQTRKNASFLTSCEAYRDFPKFHLSSRGKINYPKISKLNLSYLPKQFQAKPTRGEELSTRSFPDSWKDGKKGGKKNYPSNRFYIKHPPASIYAAQRDCLGVCTARFKFIMSVCKKRPRRRFFSRLFRSDGKRDAFPRATPFINTVFLTSLSLFLPPLPFFDPHTRARAYTHTYIFRPLLFVRSTITRLVAGNYSTAVIQRAS